MELTDGWLNRKSDRREIEHNENRSSRSNPHLIPPPRDAGEDKGGGVEPSEAIE
jgi:hypothetical protein